MASENGQENRWTLADIVEEMRTRSREVKEAFGGKPDGVENMLDIWADRIEAIDSADAWRSLYTPPVGNAAAMREALIWMKERIIAAIHDGSLDCSEVLNKIEDALKKPARNCDIYATATEALKAQDVAFNEDNFKNGECKLGCPGCDDALIDCKILWLFAQAAERKGECDDA